MRYHPRHAFIATLARLSRGVGRLLLNGLAARAGAVGGLPAARMSSVPPTVRGR